MLVFSLVLITLIVWSLVYGFVIRPAIRNEPWAKDFFDKVEPIEMAIWKRSKTILVGKLYLVSGLLLTVHESLALIVPDWTPVFAWAFSYLKYVPEDVRPALVGLAVALFSALTGQIIIWLRKATDRPLEEKRDA